MNRGHIRHNMYLGHIHIGHIQLKHMHLGHVRLRNLSTRHLQIRVHACKTQTIVAYK